MPEFPKAQVVGCLIAALNVVAVSLSGCDDPKAKAENDHAHEIAGYQAFAQHQIGLQLRDPSSARLSDLTAYKTNDKLAAICGMVNAKNGFGSYSGPQPFIISDFGTFVGEQASVEKVTAYCKGDVSVSVPDPL